MCWMTGFLSVLDVCPPRFLGCRNLIEAFPFVPRPGGSIVRILPRGGAAAFYARADTQIRTVAFLRPTSRYTVA